MWWIPVVFIILNLLIPSRDDLKYIIGGAAIVSLADVKGVEELPENLVKAANEFLKEEK